MAPVVVQRLMGHKDIGVTLNTYTTVFDKFKESKINKVNKYYLDENLIKNNNVCFIPDSTTDEREHER